MALREFTDSRGAAWTVWDVPPHRVYTPARGRSERRTQVTSGYTPERRSGRDRRMRFARSELTDGWVCFVSGREKRRLFPPPERWHAVSDEELEALCARARNQPASVG